MTKELRQLGSIGYVRGIHARLDSLEHDAPRDAAFIAQLRGLVSDFQIDAFMDALGPERGRRLMRPRDIVLVVDDSPATLGVLNEALEQAGYTVWSRNPAPRR